MDGGDLDAPLAKGTENPGDLRLDESEVAHHVRLVSRLDEGEVGAEGKGGLQRDVTQMHGKIAARKPVSVHAAVEHGRRATHRLIDGAPVERRGAPGR